MKEKIIAENAPKAIGPYSHGVICNGMVYTSGQLPVDPVSMVMPEGIAAQSKQSLLNLKAVLEAGGANLSTVVKTTCFLSDIKDFAEFNTVYAEVFGTDFAPARSCVEVACLPMNALVEVEAVAFLEK